MIRTFALLVAPQAGAAVITSTEEFQFTGYIGRQPLSNVVAKIVMTADTATAETLFYAPTSTYFPGNKLISATITNAGHGTRKFLGPTYIVALSAGGRTNFAITMPDPFGVGVGIRVAGARRRAA